MAIKFKRKWEKDSYQETLDVPKANLIPQEICREAKKKRQEEEREARVKAKKA